MPMKRLHSSMHLPTKFARSDSCPITFMKTTSFIRDIKKSPLVGLFSFDKGAERPTKEGGKDWERSDQNEADPDPAHGGAPPSGEGQKPPERVRLRKRRGAPLSPYLDTLGISRFLKMPFKWLSSNVPRGTHSIKNSLDNSCQFCYTKSGQKFSVAAHLPKL